MKPTRSLVTTLLVDDDPEDRELTEEALEAIKSDPDLRRIPVVVLTRSQAEIDVLRSYDLGANSYIAKPVTFDGMVQAMRDLGRYWFEIVALPGEHSSPD